MRRKHIPYLHQSTQFHTSDVEKYEYNVEKSKRTSLKNAGVENLKLRLAYINSSKRK